MVALAVMIPLASNNSICHIVASILGVSQVLANGLQTQQGLPAGRRAHCIALGAFVGLVNGLLVARARSFLHRHARHRHASPRLNQWYTGGRRLSVCCRRFLALSGKDPLYRRPAGPLRPPHCLVLWVVFDYLPLGRYSTSSATVPRCRADRHQRDNLRPACLCRVRHVAAFAGVVLRAQLQVGQSTVGQGLMLPAFTGALLGATAIRPGVRMSGEPCSPSPFSQSPSPA